MLPPVGFQPRQIATRREPCQIDLCSSAVKQSEAIHGKDFDAGDVPLCKKSSLIRTQVYGNLTIRCRGYLFHCCTSIVRIDIDDTPSDRAHINSAEHVHIAYHEIPVARSAPLMSVVVDACPGEALVDGSENAGDKAHFTPNIKRRIGFPGSGFTCTNGRGFQNTG